MKRPIWFKAKTYGYGWYPATWQAWIIMLVWIVLIVANFYRIDLGSYAGNDVPISFILETVILSLILVGVSYYTGEKPHWSWGKKTNKDDEKDSQSKS